MQQVVRRLSERRIKVINLPKEDTPITKQEHFDGPLTGKFRAARQYRDVSTHLWTIRNSEGNNCCLVNDRVVLVRNLLQRNEIVYAVVEDFCTRANFYDYPVESQRMGVQEVSAISGKLTVIELTNLQSKCQLLPLDEGHYVAYRLNHVDPM